MIQAIIQAFQQGGLDWTDAEIADAVWLASYIDLPAKQDTNLDQAGAEPHSVDSTNYSTHQLSNTAKLRTEKPTNVENSSATVKATAEVHLPQPKSEVSDSVKGLRGVSFHVPTATALPGKLALARSLRPLLRSVPSRTISVLDEEATVQAIAEGRNLSIVSKPAKERWLDLAIVIDDWETMVIWQETVLEFVELLRQLGAFRTVQTYRLSTELQLKDQREKREATQLYLTSSSNDLQGRVCNPRELIDPQSRQLILIASDCTSPIWSNGAMGQLLATWGENSIVALVQMLPTSLWEGCALGKAIQVYLSAHSNRTTTATFPWYWQNDTMPLGRALPVFSLQPESIEIWCNFLMGKGGQIPGFYLPLKMSNQSTENSKPDSDELLTEQLITQFRANASPTARELAGYLAAAPLSLPIMRLIQHTMLPQSRQIHLAEVFRSGLIKRISSAETSKHTDDIRYDFVLNVRQHLLATVLLGDTKTVVEKVSEFFSNQDFRMRNFHALISDPTSQGEIVVDDENRMIATITAAVLQRLGSRYSELAAKLQRLALKKKLLQFVVEKDTILTVVTEKGHRIRFDSSNGSVTVSTARGQHVHLDRENIKVESDGAIQINAPQNINISANGSVILRANITLDVQGAMIRLNSNGRPAAYLGGLTAHGGTIVAGAPTVLIGGTPAARVGDMHTCPMVTGMVPHVGGPVATGSSTVLIGGIPAGRVGDLATCVGPIDTIAIGNPTILIGD